MNSICYNIMIGLAEISRNNEFYSIFNWGLLLLGRRDVYNSSGDFCDNLEDVNEWKDNYSSLKAENIDGYTPTYDKTRECLYFNDKRKYLTISDINNAISDINPKFEIWMYIDFDDGKSRVNIISDYINAQRSISVYRTSGKRINLVTSHDGINEGVRAYIVNVTDYVGIKLIRIKVDTTQTSFQNAYMFYIDNILQTTVNQVDDDRSISSGVRPVRLCGSDNTVDWGLKGSIAMFGIIKGNLTNDESNLLYNRIKNDYNKF